MSKVLGKGLSALIPEKDEATSEANVKYVKTETVSDNTQQPRTNYDEDKLLELKASIKEKGVLQPILVRERDSGYEVVAGERRLRAARDLGLEEIPVLVKNVSDQEALVIALVENIQREELNPIEEAEAYQKLINDFQYTHDTIAKSVGKERSTVTNFLRLLNLSKDIQKEVYDKKLSVGHARALLGVESDSRRKELCSLAIKKGLSVRALEQVIKTDGKPSKAAKSKSKRPDDIVALEGVLKEFFGTKVSVSGTKSKGKISIDYYSFGDLERILKLIRK